MLLSGKIMRKIKFRVWDKINRRWLMGEEYLINSDAEIFLLTGEGDDDGAPVMLAWDQEDYIIQQYTGINDIDGKEIYEGDIVNLYSSFHKKPLNLFPRIITYHAPSFICNNLADTHDPGWYLFQPMVIGNIFENPDLLDG